MKIKVEETKPNKKKTAMLCSFVFEKSKEAISLGRLNSDVDNTIKEAITETKGKVGEISISHTLGKIPAKRVLIAGIGPKDKLTIDVIRDVSGKVSKKAASLELPEFSLVFPHKLPFSTDSITQAIVEGAKLSLYSFDKFKKEKNGKCPNLSILTTNPKKITKKVQESEIGANAVIFTRDIANLPPNECSPSTLARFAQILATKNKLRCKVFSKKELLKKRFGGILAVGSGSKNEPKLIVLEYRGGKKINKPIVLVGKAVTFDTGGISLKPSEKMDEMKFDKCGGCNVLGIMKAVSELKLPVNVVGVIPSVENMPGGESYRPGDIVRLFNGKTAEILNTDAEGRLILADGLAYGEKTYEPTAIIDFATLTGACIVALGNNVAGMISNNKGLATKIVESSENSSEEIWQLPINDDYKEMIKSNVADMKNIGKGRAAGTITAAAFLANAINTAPWVHIDIAGTAWTQDATKKKSYNPKGATGFGVRLVVDYLSRT